MNHAFLMINTYFGIDHVIFQIMTTRENEKNTDQVREENTSNIFDTNNNGDLDLYL